MPAPRDSTGTPEGAESRAGKTPRQALQLPLHRSPTQSDGGFAGAGRLRKMATMSEMMNPRIKR